MNWQKTRERLIEMNSAFVSLPADWDWRINLSGANLSGANLSDADLSEANLSDADLSDADLGGANLSGANLSDADLSEANLSEADLSGANLSGANLSDADLGGANLSGAKGLEIPVIENIDKAIYDAITTGGHLDMSQWHTCETTHCRAGWTVILAGEAGLKLERQMGTGSAAAFIYAKSRPGQPIPNWFDSNEEVLAELEEAASVVEK